MADSTRISRPSDLTKLAKEGDGLQVQNTLGSIAVFRLNDQEDTEWAAKGDLEGNDIKEVPSTYLKNSNFRQAVLRGIFTIIDADNPEVLEAVEAQRNAWEAKQAQRADAEATIVKTQGRSFTGTQCISMEQGRQCSEYSVISGKNMNEKPALCQKHAHLANQYVPIETGKIVDEKPEVIWSRASLTS